MIRRQLINFGTRSTDFRMGFGALSELSRMVSAVVATPKRAVIVTDASLASAHGLEVSRALIDAGFTVEDLSFPSGEHVSTLAYAMQLFEALDRSAITADDVIVALGGVEVCSLVTYCAGSWCGGTTYVLLPTTLDAMVTSATTMTPLDTSSSSQMVHVEPRASLAVCDLFLLADCSEDELRSGYVELIMAALIDSRRQWERMDSILPGAVSGEEVPLYDLIGMAQSARVRVLTSANPSARNAIQFGRTTARALKHCLGDAVPDYALLAEGMRFEARLAHDVTDFDVDDVFTLDDLLDEAGIDEVPFDLGCGRFIEALKDTRFKRSNRLMFSLPRHPGTIRFSVVDDEVLERHARAYLASRAELMDGSR